MVVDKRVVSSWWYVSEERGNQIVSVLFVVSLQKLVHDIDVLTLKIDGTNLFAREKDQEMNVKRNVVSVTHTVDLLPVDQESSEYLT